MRNLQRFIYAWMQVSLVCLNTWQIANGKIAGAIFVGFLISLVWCFNIQGIAFSKLSEKITYAFGACCGTATGLLASNILY
jgi:hypothetical protein